MFKEQLKSQYLWYYTGSLVFAVLNIILDGFREPIVIDIFVNLVFVSILAFVAFCIVFCVSWLVGKISSVRQNLSILL